jgi:hypothetical protein
LLPINPDFEENKFKPVYSVFVETSYYRLYTTSNTISMNAITRAWRLQLEECREEKARAS